MPVASFSAPADMHSITCSSERPTAGAPTSHRPPPKLDGAAWFYEIPAAELRGRGTLTFRGFLKTDGVTGPGFAHFSVYQIAADGSLPTWRDLCQVRGSEDWKEHRFGFEVHPQAATVSLRAGLYRGRGTAWFDEVRLTDEAGNVLLEADFEQRRFRIARGHELVADAPGTLHLAKQHRSLRLPRPASHAALRDPARGKTQLAPRTA